MSSADGKYDILITGYIHAFEASHCIDIPPEIAQLILVFFSAKINYAGLFLSKNAGRCIKIGEDALSITGYRSAKLDKALPVALENKQLSVVYRWRALNETFSAYGNLFGVVSNQSTDFHAYPYSSNLNAYGITMKPQKVFLGQEQQNDASFQGFRENEVIIMEYEISNGNQCKLSFFNETKHNQFLYCIDLPNSIAITSWYPVFSKPNSGSTCIRVIPFDDCHET